MREKPISQSLRGHNVTLKCDRAYLHDVRDANTHYIRAYVKGAKSTRSAGRKKIYDAHGESQREGNLSFANCVKVFLMNGHHKLALFQRVS